MTQSATENLRPEVLVIAGSDSSGLAGIQRDNASITAMGCHAVNVITANTAQNHEGVQGVYPIDELVFKHQLHINSQRPVRAVKIGLVTSASQVDAIISCLEQEHLKFVPVIFDPVLAASSGETFGESSAGYTSMREAILRLLPYCTLVTPNLAEAQQLTQKNIENDDDLINVAQSLVKFGARHVLIKGGHAASNQARDFYYSYQQQFCLHSEKQQSTNLRGTGCAFASCLASACALGYSLEDAVVLAKMAINQGIRQSYALAAQPGPVHVTHFPDTQEDLPQLVKLKFSSSTIPSDAPFPLPHRPNGEPTKLGLYPVIDRASWLQRLLPLGISTIQLRVKDLTGAALGEEIRTAVNLSEQYNCRLFINDHWQLAIEHKAYGVHLGQEDLDDADISAIKNAGLRLGISTHCHYEVARAHAFRPSYIACGPMYHTNTKQMSWVPHGPRGLAYWRKVLNYPLVAIGGINSERLADILEQKPDGIAMITAITLADDPEATAQQFHTTIEQVYAS